MLNVHGDSDITITVRIRDAATRGLRGLVTGIGKLRGALGIASQAVFSLKGALAGLGVGVLGKSFIDAASTAEQFRVRLNVLTGSVAEGNKLFKEMADFASNVAFTYEDIMSSATNLTGVVERGTEEVGELMPLIADLAAASGLGIRDTTNQVIRMYSAGAQAADMFRERGVLAMLGFQAGVSYSTKQTREQLMKAWDGPESRIKGAAALLGRTWTGMMSMLSDRWFQFRNLVMDSGVFDYIKGAVQIALDFFQRLQKEGRLEEWATGIAEAVIDSLEGIARGAAVALDIWRGWRLLITQLTEGFAAFGEIVNRVYASIIDGVTEVISLFGHFDNAVTQTLRNTANELRNAADWWSGIKEESRETLFNIAGQETYLKRTETMLGKIREKAAGFRREYEEALKASEGRPALRRPAPTASPVAMMRAQLEEFKATTETELLTLEQLYDKGETNLEDFFERRAQILAQAYSKEQLLLEKMVEAEALPDRKVALQSKLVQITEKYNRDILKLTQDRVQAELAEEQFLTERQITIRDMAIRELAARSTESGLGSQFSQELLQMDQRHAEEIARLKEHVRNKDLIEEAYRVQKLEKERLITDQQKRLQEEILSTTARTLGGMAEGFKQLYQETGEDIEAFFQIYKAAAIAEAIIATYQSAVEAYKATVGIPVVGPTLAPIAAATAVLGGMAKVAAIRSQSLAEGGEVQGTSPHSNADNIRANLTAGEYVHPVSAVKHYGLAAMDAIRSKAIPRAVMQNFASNFTRPAIPRFGYAVGGAVMSQIPSQPEAGSGQQVIENNITNITDPRLIDQYMATPRGQQSIVNVVTNNFDMQPKR